MNKQQLCNSVAEALGITQDRSHVVVNAVLGAIAMGLRKDGEVSVRHFGKFTATDHSPNYKYRNPKTGEAAEARYTKQLRFTPFEYLRHVVGGK